MNTCMQFTYPPFCEIHNKPLNGLLLTKLRVYQAVNYSKCNQWKRKKGQHFTSISAKLEECKKKGLW